MDKLALKLRVSGIVQGVGFRPFIYRIAVKSKVKGYVRNMGGSEVEIHIEGTNGEILTFLRLLESEKPPPARIEEIEMEESKPRAFNRFEILKSNAYSKIYSMIPPDIGICDYCLQEILDKNSRWYNYPFNSCAWCGPRFSILEKLPYDRENTAMKDFPLCEPCLSEYKDPNDIRRFHAQGISCSLCGPKVWLTDNRGEVLNAKDPIMEAAKLIDEGNIVAIKGLGGFHIAGLATDDDVVLLLRKRKRRPQKPFALMALNVKVAEKIIVLNDKLLKLLTSAEKPIVLAPKRENTEVSEYIAPGLDTLGVMLPYTGLHYLLLMQTKDKFLIMTSGNPKGKPMCIDEKCAYNKLSEYVDYFLMHNRRIINRIDDSVVRLTNGKLSFLRRSRGYAPTWFKSPFKMKKPILAFGAELSNVGAIGLKERIIPTQYIGDMDDFETLNFLEEALNFLVKAYNIDVEDSIVVSDAHPYYATTRLAEEWSRKYRIPLVKVQHHHAHIVSAMVEHKLPTETKIVGIAIDGVGYGDDKRIWGGEVLITSYKKYIRVGHLKYQPMPGGDLATIYPVRMLTGILSSALGLNEAKEFILKNKLYEWLKYGYRELNVIMKQIVNKFYVETSSLGRILDAVSALLGVCYHRTYEGEPAMKLEAYARGGKILDYQPKIILENGIYIVDITDMFQWILSVINDSNKKDIALTIQHCIGEALAKICLKVIKGSKLPPKIVVSGGAAVNDYIIKAIIVEAMENDVEVLLNRKVPPGDGGLALGQVAVAAQYSDED